jgi:uncharacterized protein YbjT (DUF2867 family)
VILVIGGRSKIGSALIGELVAKGERVRALVRTSESGGSLPEGVEPLSGDLGDLGSLRAAISGVERLFPAVRPDQRRGPTQPQRDRRRQGGGPAAAGAKLDPRVRPHSAATFIRDHGNCDAYLAESGAPHAIVRPNLFIQNIPENTIPSIDADGNFYANAGDARISMTDTRDVAAVAATLLTEPGHEGRIYEVTGPEALSYDDVATKLSQSLGRPITYVDAPDDAVRTALLGFGLGEWLVEALIELFQDYRRSGTDGYAARVTDTVERLTGRPPRSLDQLLAEQPAPAT